MSKDPFEELFGRPVQKEAEHDSATSQEKTAETPAPVASTPAKQTEATAKLFADDQKPAPETTEALPAPVSARRVTAAEAEAQSRREFEETLTAQLAALAAQQETEAPAPVPASRAASGMGTATIDQAAPAPLKPEPASKNANPQKEGSRALPWIIVSGIAVIAIAIASLVVGIVNSNRNATTQVASEKTTTAPKSTKTESNQDSTETKSEESEAETENSSKAETGEKETTEKEANEQAPTVDVGSTMEMPIGPWNATSQLSQRFGTTYFNIPDGTNMYLTSDLLESFPDSCSQMREGWGASKQADGTYKLLKPSGSCSAAPELYREIWGLLQAWVDTIKPAS